MASLVMLASMAFFVFAIRSQQGTDLAKYLPAEETHAMLVVDLDKYIASTREPSPLLGTLFGTPVQSLSWFKKEVGIAWVNQDLVQFIQVEDRSEAKAWLETFKAEDEEWVIPEDTRQVTCYSYSRPECFAFEGPFLVLSSSVESLELITMTPQSQRLRQDSRYQNIKGRLPLLSDAYAFINLQTSRLELIHFFNQLGVHEPGYMESLLRLFPAYGMSIKMQPGQWYAEAATLVDKGQLDGQAYYHPNLKYRHDLLGYGSEAFLLEWGGENLWGQQEALSQLFETLNPSAALTFDSSLESAKSKLFGDLPLENLKDYLSNEFYFAWTPGEDFLLLLEAESPSQELKEGFLANYRHPQGRVTETGEVLADVLGLWKQEDSHEGHRYDVFFAGEEFVVGTAVVDGIIVISSSQEELRAAMDRIQGRQSRQSLSNIEGLLPGSDEVWRLRLQSLPEEHILKVLLPGVESIHSTRKHFDDGFFTRHSLILSQ